MTKEYDYLSDKIVENQQKYLNNFITKINNNIINGIIEVKGKDKADKNERALTTDTHGDLMSIMGAAVMCGVKFKENEFLYYDRNEGIYYEKVDGKYYEYTPPYTGIKKQRKPKSRIKKDNSIIVVPIPDTENARDLYHLGDVIDRGKESLTSLLLCEICPNIKIAQGNHEFMNRIDSKYNGAYSEEIDSINLILARMKHSGKINTVYYDGKDNNVISYSHIPLTEDQVVRFFIFLKAVYIDNKYSNEEPPVLKFIKEEFVKQLNLKEYKYFILKLKDFLLKKSNISDFNTIKDIFTKEEMLIIKNVVSGALIERQFKLGEDGKITFINDGFKDVYLHFNELCLNDSRNVDIINFEDSEKRENVNIVCSSVAGHEAGVRIRFGKENMVLYIDDIKSSGYNQKRSIATVTDINIETGEIIHNSFIAERKSELIDNDNILINDEFKKNDNLKEYENNNSINFRLPKEAITKVKSVLDILEIDIYIKNIFESNDNINFESFKELFDYLENNEELYYSAILNIFDRAYKEEKYEIIENLLDSYIDKIFTSNVSKMSINNFFIKLEFIFSNHDNINNLRENIINNITTKDENLISKLFILAVKYDYINTVDKLLSNENLKDKLNQNIQYNLKKLTFNTLYTGNIEMAKVLIKHGFKFDTKELIMENKDFDKFENTLITLVNEYNIKKENFKKINFSLVGKNIFKYKSIKKTEFERLNDVLDLIKEQIENNQQTQQNNL